jgi:hypothetical protein
MLRTPMLDLGTQPTYHFQMVKYSHKLLDKYRQACKHGIRQSRATLTVNISSPSADDNGNLTIQIPRDIVDNKKEGNADAPFRVHVDGKDATFKENDNTKTTRTLSIQFGKDAKVIDIIGSKSTVQ